MFLREVFCKPERIAVLIDANFIEFAVSQINFDEEDWSQIHVFCAADL